jgi:hypothetical protein
MSHGLGPRATLTFAGMLCVGAASCALVVAPVRLIVGDTTLEVRSLGRSRSVPLATLRRFELVRGALHVEAAGQPPRRYRLAGRWRSTATSLHEWEQEAEELAHGPIELARSRSAARVFE